MKKIPPGFILPSAAFTIRKNRIRRYQLLDKKPEVGDLAYGRVRTLGHHSGIENGLVT